MVIYQNLPKFVERENEPRGHTKTWALPKSRSLCGVIVMAPLLESYKKYENCFITSPTYYDEDSKLSYSSGYLPEKNSKKDILNLEGDICVEAVLGSIILFKKKDIIELGLFDENFFLYYLDFELCRRIINRKKSIIQIFDTKAQHVHGQLKVKNLLKRVFIRNYHFTFDELYYFFKIKFSQNVFFSIWKD